METELYSPVVLCSECAQVLMWASAPALTWLQLRGGRVCPRPDALAPKERDKFHLEQNLQSPLGALETGSLSQPFVFLNPAAGSSVRRPELSRRGEGVCAFGDRPERAAGPRSRAPRQSVSFSRAQMRREQNTPF